MCASLSLGCGGGDDPKGDAQPGVGQILRAVMTSLVSNAIDAREQDAADADPAPTPGPPEGPPELAVTREPEAPQTCEIPYNGPVTIIRAPTPTAFARSRDERRRAALVYETDDTAIWEDGRVLTTDVENLGTHLNAVGWSSNPMQIVGASTRPGGSGQNVGWNSATSSFQDSKTTEKRKQKRRRG